MNTIQDLAMSTQIVLNPVYAYRINEDRTSVFLFFDDGHEFKAIRNDLVVDVIDQLGKESHTTFSMLAALGNKYKNKEVSETLYDLEKDGFIINPAPELHADLIVQWCNAENTPLMLQHALQNTNVVLQSFGVDDTAFRNRLETVGIQFSSEEKADFAIILTDDVLTPELEAFNKQAMQAEMPWIMARGVGQKLWFTVFIPQETPCWYCFSQAVRRNRAGLLWFDTKKQQDHRGSQLQSKERMLAPMAAAYLENLALHRIFYGDFSDAEGNLYTMNALTGEVDAPRRYTQTTSCSWCTQVMPESDTTFLPLEPRKKKFTNDGGHRTSDPETAFNTYSHLIDPYVGFFRHLRRLDTGENDLVHTFMMQYSQTGLFYDSNALFQTEVGYSYGKGISMWQSKASCLFEAIERYSGQWRTGISVIERTYEDMEERVVHPHDLLQFSDQQYRNRHEWNSNCPEKFVVFDPFDEKKRIEWVAAYSLSTMERVYIPAAYGFYNYPGSGFGSEFLFADSNGCSAGLTREEAILQGLFEVIERDALALAFGHRASFTRVDLTGVTLPYFEEMNVYLASRRRSLEVYRVPSEFDIPCYIAISECLEGERAILSGFGCHLDPTIAVARAVTELGQTLFSESRDSAQRALKDKYREQKYHQVTCLKNSAQEVDERLIDVEKKTTLDVTEDLKICTEMLAGKGIEVLVLDQTDPQLGCPVVKVVVPGMYHFWYRKGGRRMKDVPELNNWCNGALSEEAIEPFWLIV